LGFEASVIDHTGIDVIAYNPSTNQRLGITVKARTRNIGKERPMPMVEHNTDIRIAEFNILTTMSKSEVARQLGISRAYVTMLSQGKRKPSLALQKKLTEVFYTQKVRGSSPLSPTTPY